MIVDAASDALGARKARVVVSPVTVRSCTLISLGDGAFQGGAAALGVLDLEAHFSLGFVLRLCSVGAANARCVLLQALDTAFLAIHRNSRHNKPQPGCALDHEYWSVLVLLFCVLGAAMALSLHPVLTCVRTQEGRTRKTTC